jgi:hypothetical protein
VGWLKACMPKLPEARLASVTLKSNAPSTQALIWLPLALRRSLTRCGFAGTRVAKPRS